MRKPDSDCAEVAGQQCVLDLRRPRPTTRRVFGALTRDEVRYAVDVSVHVIPAKERRLHEIYGAKNKARLFLVRPDGHVAFVGSLRDLDDLATQMNALFHGRVAHTGHPKRSINLMG